MVRWFASYPRFSALLGTVYTTTMPLCFVTALVCAISGKSSRARELVFCYASCILVAAVFAMFLPALGSTVYHGLDGLAGLPVEAGSYHMPVAEYYRSAAYVTFGLDKVSGVVTFPSFHMIMGLLVPYACRGRSALFWPATAWAGLVGISAIVIGGHYLIDLIAGAVCWAISVMVANWCHARSHSGRTRSPLND